MASAHTPWYSQQRARIPLLFHPQTELFPVLLKVPTAPTTMSPAHFLPLALVGRGGEGMCQPVLSTALAFTLTGQHAHTETGGWPYSEAPAPLPSNMGCCQMAGPRKSDAPPPPWAPAAGFLEQRPTWVPGSISPRWEVPIAHGPGRGVMELEIKGVGATIPDHRHLWGGARSGSSGPEGSAGGWEGWLPVHRHTLR